MYKFPITKNGAEYAIEIVENEYFKRSFEVTLYVQKKCLWFMEDVEVCNGTFSFPNEDIDYYNNLVKNNILYLNLTSAIMNKYEKILAENQSMNKNVEAFINWDGNLDKTKGVNFDEPI